MIAATLLEEHGVAARFEESTTICIERPAGSGEAVEYIGTDPNPFLATVGLRVEPAPAGSGIAFGLEVELGSMPLSYFTAVEETVAATFAAGGLHGWRVEDARVTMTHSGYWAKQSSAHGVFDKSMSSTARDFRDLTPVVLLRALAAAGTVVCEPVHRFRLEAPADALGVAPPRARRARRRPGRAELAGDDCVVTGELPAASVHALRMRLPDPHARRGPARDGVRPLQRGARLGAAEAAPAPGGGGAPRAVTGRARDVLVRPGHRGEGPVDERRRAARRR